MGLLKSKPKLSVEDCCRDFYDSQIFKAEIDDSVGMAPWSYYLDKSKDLIAEDAQTFSGVDSDSFWHEMTALRMAVFGLTCSLKVKHKTELIVRQVFFTRHYLEHNQRVDLWYTLLDYNDVIDHSAFMKDDGQSAEMDSAWRRGRVAFLIDPQDADMNSGWARHRITFINNFRFGLFKEWIKSNIADPQSQTDGEKEKLECLSIALKRVCADIPRVDCNTVKLLTMSLAERLGCDININQRALFKLGIIIFGFHTIADNYLKSVTLQ